MLWAIVWLLLVAVMWGLFMSRISESPLSNRPVLSGLIVGFSGFCLLSTCLPVFAVLASTSWNVLTGALWEGMIALTIPGLCGWALTSALAERENSVAASVEG